MTRAIASLIVWVGIVLTCALLLWPHDVVAAASGFRIVDDWGRELVLARRPQRIVSLSPHATELLFSVGAGPQVIAVDQSSDYPPEVRSLPSLNAHPLPDLERLLALKADLLVAWGAGIGRDRLARFEAFGLPVFISEPRSLAAIADSIERFARLTDKPEVGLRRALKFRTRIGELRARYSDRRPIRLFVQAWRMPLTTLSDRDTIGDAIRLCGGLNPFAELPLAAPQIGLESVVASSPELIVGFDSTDARLTWEAVGLLEPRGAAGFALIDRAIQRPSERILPAIEQLCEAIDARRSKDKTSSRD